MICSCIPFDRPALCARTQKPRRHGRVHVAELPLRVRPLRQHDADKRQRRGQHRFEHAVERDHARKIPIRKRRKQRLLAKDNKRRLNRFVNSPA